MMATNEADPAAQPLGLPGELQAQIACNLDTIDLLRLSAASRTLRTEMVPRLFASLTLANSEKSTQSVNVVVSKYGYLVKEFTYVITFEENTQDWCDICNSCEKAGGAPADYWVRDFSQVYKVLSTLYSSMENLESLRMRVISQDMYKYEIGRFEGSVTLFIRNHILTRVYSNRSINTVLARSFNALAWNFDLKNLTLECPLMEFNLDTTSCGDGSMSTVLARLKSLRLDLDMTTFLNGKDSACGYESDDWSHDEPRDTVFELNKILVKCSSLQELHISANRTFFGSGRAGSKYRLGDGPWTSNLQRLTLSRFLVDGVLQDILAYCVRAVQTVVLVDCYATVSRSPAQPTWSAFFKLLVWYGFPAISLRRFEVLNSRSKTQLDYANVIGEAYRFEIAEPEGALSVEDQRSRDREAWDCLQATIASNVKGKQAANW